MNKTIIISASNAAIEAITENFKNNKIENFNVSEKRHITGESASLILAASVGVQILPTILTFIKDLVKKEPMTLTVGDWKVENPTPELIEEFLRRSQKENG